MIKILLQHNWYGVLFVPSKNIAIEFAVIIKKCVQGVRNGKNMNIYAYYIRAKYIYLDISL